MEIAMRMAEGPTVNIFIPLESGNLWNVVPDSLKRKAIARKNKADLRISRV
jgi:hypothetical protein